MCTTTLALYCAGGKPEAPCMLGKCSTKQHPQAGTMHFDPTVAHIYAKRLTVIHRAHLNLLNLLCGLSGFFVSCVWRQKLFAWPGFILVSRLLHVSMKILLKPSFNENLKPVVQSELLTTISAHPPPPSSGRSTQVCFQRES